MRFEPIEWSLIAGPDLFFVEELVARDLAIPRTRYKRIGAFSAASRAPKIDRTKKVVLIFFPTSPRLAYVIGAAYGDGSASTRRLTYFNMDREWIVALAKDLRLLTESGKPEPQVLPSGWRGCPLIEYCNSALARLVRGSPIERVRVADILTRGRMKLAAFAAGIFDTEGSATLYVNEGHKDGTPEISIANSNVRMLRMLRSRLQAYGILGNVTIAARPRITFIEGRRVKWKKTVYRLRYTGWASAVKFGKFVLPWSKSRAKTLKLQEIIEEWGRRDLNSRSPAIW